MIRIGPNFTVGLETDLVEFGNIDRGIDQLEGGLLLNVSDIDRDLARAVVLQGRSGIVGVFNPANGLVDVACPGSGGNWRGGLYSIRGQRIRLHEGRSKGEKLTNGVAKAEGKTAAKANKSVAARIVKKVESV